VTMAPRPFSPRATQPHPGTRQAAADSAPSRSYYLCAETANSQHRVRVSSLDEAGTYPPSQNWRTRHAGVPTS
jgi:hypothetical protein